jgi:predicted Zn-dependent peptidase
MMTLAMLNGTPKFSKSGIDELYARLLAPLPTWSWWPDAVRLSETFASDKLDAAVDALAEIVLRPAFERHELERSKNFQAQPRDSVIEDASFAENIVGHALFGAHVYGGFLTARGLRAVQREEIVALYGRTFLPSQMALVAVGGAEDAKVLAALERAFGDAPARVEPSASAPAHPPATVTGPRLVVVDKPGSDVSFVAEGFATPPAESDDEVAARMAIWVEMGNSVGRGPARLRDELKLVPWVGTFGWVARLAGIQGWRTQAPTAKVAAVLAEADAVTRSLATTGPTPDELEAVRAAFGGDFVRPFKTTAGAAITYSLRFARGLPFDGLAADVARVDAMTAESLRAAAAKYMDPSRTRVVIVGDLAALRAPLRALGWGPIEVRDAAGAVVRIERAN